MPGEGAAARLEGLGLEAGHRVAVCSSSARLHLEVHGLARRLGLAVVPLAPQAPAPVQARQAVRGSAHVVLADAALAPRLAGSAPGAPVVALEGSRVVAGGRHVVVPVPAPGDDGVRLVLHSSGSTGEPHAVAVHDRCLAAHAEATSRRLGGGPGAAWLLVLPPHHAGGAVLLDRALRIGGRLVLRDRFDAADALAALHGEQVTHVSLVPLMLERLLRAARERGPPDALGCVLVGGDAMPPDLLREALDLGWPVHPTYGLTEACGQVATATPEEAAEHAGTSGRPLDGVRVSIGAGAEIRVSGPTVAGGVVDTGDLGRLDDEGRLFVTGRRVERIVTGGKTVDARALESVLESHPAVASALVVGVPDPQWGQRVGAVVEAHPGAALGPDALQAWLRGRVEPHQVPRSLRLVDALPRTLTGKKARGEARRMLDGG